MSNIRSPVRQPARNRVMVLPALIKRLGRDTVSTTTKQTIKTKRTQCFVPLPRGYRQPRMSSDHGVTSTPISDREVRMCPLSFQRKHNLETIPRKLTRTATKDIVSFHLSYSSCYEQTKATNAAQFAMKTFDSAKC